MMENSAQAAALLKILSNEQRLLILCMLHENELSVGQLNEMIPNLSQSALSQHLSLLRREDLVATRRDSQTIYYKLASSDAARIIHLMHELFCSEACQ
ncbi:helix-turn-helix transcriptional regulator [Kangiella sp. HZ709]|uniref:ArsR/SmtB family transcription factor n=1 Tax=Kangiella sp. HZ709 TaxID=2666328 RepID=UPI0012B0474A|nr:metalloregulator ArsR/SmtB family transcription factor [Kangiella sp. HZ709]MRX27979.1 metalloregulator ArsR/SmtB family transcription factor [Kangiella sp. HZ709]